MKEANFNYSLKNIPLPKEDTFLKGLIIKCEDFIQRLRWKVIHFLNDKNKDDVGRIDDNYGFKTPKNAPQHKSLTSFENDLGHLIANLEYRENNNSRFQTLLKKDVKYINRSKNIFVQADKTNNIYEMEPDEYRKLMRDNITSIYSRADVNYEKEINTQAKKITDKLNISDRVEKIGHKNAYITLKDHKKEFPQKIKCRLINPMKSNIGQISKQMLEEINKDILKKTKLRQLKNTEETIKWFQNTNFKTRKQFIQIDIVDYYPSVSNELFQKAIKFANEYTFIDETTINTILNARKTLLYHENRIWTKTEGGFDIPMGSYDGAELTDLVGLYILHRLKQTVPEIDFGLYRDDGLGMYRRIPATRLNKIIKTIKDLFKEMGLEITMEKDLTRVNFLDITFDLSEETFEQYRKPNDKPNYVNVESNHPKMIIKNIPKAVNRRLSEISCSNDKFIKHKETYQNALNNSGHRYKLQYEDIDRRVKTKKTKQRKRKILYFNPPYNKNLKTNIGKEFLKIIDKNFPRDNPLHKIINRKNIKLSYSCTTNMKKIISGHNMKILNENEVNENEQQCNCRGDCILPGQCRSKCVVYKASIENIQYIGSTSNEFKTRYRNHKASFINEDKRNETALAQYIWTNNLNRDEQNMIVPPNVKWEILKKCKVYSGGEKTCDLCTTEKFFILKNIRNVKSINHRSDLGAKCIHRNTAKLSRVT